MKVNNNNKVAIKMAIALVLGLVVGYRMLITKRKFNGKWKCRSMDKDK